jgi:hypothetical protein
LPTQIKITRGSTTPSGLTTGEFAINTSTNQLWVGGTASGVWVGGEITGGTDMGGGSVASQNRVPTQNAVYEYARRNFVASFNGATGAVTGASLGANTFTGLQTLTAGLSASGGITFGSNVTINGNLNATTKSFVIPHPTRKNATLHYGSLEGPEHGVYVRGRLTGENTITLPKYWSKLVDEESITVTLTPIGSATPHFVKSVSSKAVKIGSSGEIDCFYMVNAERKDVPKLQVEY